MKIQCPYCNTDLDKDYDICLYCGSHIKIHSINLINKEPFYLNVISKHNGNKINSLYLVKPTDFCINNEAYNINYSLENTASIDAHFDIISVNNKLFTIQLEENNNDSKEESSN